MIELATPETARYVADNLGPDEICVREYGREDAAALCFECASESIMSWAVIAATGEPVCLFGADGEKGDSWGSAWMFSTERVSKARFELVRGARTAIAFSRQYWPELRIFAEDRSDKQTKFLRLVGFRPSVDDEKELRI